MLRAYSANAFKARSFVPIWDTGGPFVEPPIVVAPAKKRLRAPYHLQASFKVTEFPDTAEFKADILDRAYVSIQITEAPDVATFLISSTPAVWKTELPDLFRLELQSYYTAELAIMELPDQMLVEMFDLIAYNNDLLLTLP